MDLVRRAGELVSTYAGRRAFRRVSLGLAVVLAVFLVAAGLADNTVRLVRMDPSGEVPTRTNFNFFFSADVVPKGAVGNLWQVYEDRSAHWDAWDIPQYYVEHPLPGPVLERLRVVERGAARWPLRGNKR